MVRLLLGGPGMCIGDHTTSATRLASSEAPRYTRCVRYVQSLSTRDYAIQAELLTDGGYERLECSGRRVEISGCRGLRQSICAPRTPDFVSYRGEQTLFRSLSVRQLFAETCAGRIVQTIAGVVPGEKNDAIRGWAGSGYGALAFKVSHAVDHLHLLQQ